MNGNVDNVAITPSDFHMLRYSTSDDDNSFVDINIKLDDRINKTPSKDSKSLTVNSSAGKKRRNRERESFNSCDTDDSSDEKDKGKGSVSGSVRGSVTGSVRGSVTGSVRGSVKGSVRDSVKGSARDQSRRSDDENYRLENSRLAFSNADRKLESKVMKSKMRHNNESNEKNPNEKFHDRLKDYSTPISYDSDAYKNWNIFIIFLSIVTAYYTPYRISFETSRSSPWYSTLQGFEIAFDLIFIINMFLHAFHFYSPATISTTTCYTDGFKLRSEIFISYLTKSKGKRFLIDLVSSIPWEFLVNSSNLNTQFGLGIIRTVRLYWVAKLLMFLLLETHWFACLFYFVAITEPDYKSTWLYNSVQLYKPDGVPKSASQRYLLSLYWAWITASTAGYGDITAQSNREYVIVILYTFFNIIFTAYIVGNMTSVITNNSEQTRMFRQNYDALTTFIKVNMIPSDIAISMKEHALLQFSVADEHLDVLDSIPDHLKTRCQHFLYRPIIESSIFSESVSDTFIDRFSCALKLEVVMPGNDIIVQDDASSVMYFIVSGSAETVYKSVETTYIDDVHENIGGSKVKRFSTALKSVSDRGSTQAKTITKVQYHVLNFLGMGSPVGEISFFFNLLQPFAVRTSKICRLLTLRSDDWTDKLEALYPIDSTLFKKTCFNNIIDQIQQYKREPGFSFTGNSIIDEEIMEKFLDLERELYYSETEWEHDKVGELCLAAANDNIITLKKLLTCGISINASDYDKRNPLMVAGSKGSVNAVKFFLEKGADFRLVDVFGNTALSDACRNGHDSCCSVLYDFGARLTDSIDEYSAGSMMCTAISKGDHAGLMRLLKYGLHADSGDYDRRRALHVASAGGDLRAISILLDSGADPCCLDNFGRTPLLEAVRAGFSSAAKILYNSGAKLEFLDTDRDSVQVGANINNDVASKADVVWKTRILTSSELVNCVSRLDTSYLRLLLEFGADPNKAFDYDLRSPAHLAVCMNSVELCTLLLEYKADFVSEHSRDRWNVTPLEEATKVGNNFLYEVIQNILKSTSSK